MGLFGAAHGWGVGRKGPLPKIRYTHPTMLKLSTVIPSLKRFKKCIIHARHPLSSADISIFHQKLANFVISGNKDKIDCIYYRTFDSFDCYRVLKACLDQRDCNFDKVSNTVCCRPS